MEISNRVMLAVRYGKEPLCSSLDNLNGWFQPRGIKISPEDDSFTVGGRSINFEFMPSIETVSFSVDVDSDDEFPSILFDFVNDLSDDKSIISLAECDDISNSFSNCSLIYEANLKVFRKEMLNMEGNE